jgi:hypothetical protein
VYYEPDACNATQYPNERISYIITLKNQYIERTMNNLFATMRKLVLCVFACSLCDNLSQHYHDASATPLPHHRNTAATLPHHRNTALALPRHIRITITTLPHHFNTTATTPPPHRSPSSTTPLQHTTTLMSLFTANVNALNVSGWAWRYPLPSGRWEGG